MSHADFKGFFDFCARVEIRLVNRRALEALICSGAFDGLADNGHRAAYMLAIDSALDYSKSMSEGHNSSMDSLFAGGDETSFTEPQLPEIPIWTDEYRLEKENEYLNYYVTGHPLMKYEAHIDSLSSVTTKNFNGVKTDDPVSYCGIITDIRTRIDKNKKTIGFITIEDFTGKAECIFWSKAWEENEKYIIKNSIVYIYGKVKDVPEIKEVENLIDESEDSQEKDEILKIVVDYIEPIEKVVNEFCTGFKIWINEDDKELKSKLEELSKIQLLTKGAKSILIINLKQNSGQKILIYEAEKANIIPNSENTIKLMGIFGNNSIRLLMNRMERNEKLDKRQSWKKKQ
ncbi:MAG: OB-fold nucleic acid binding domain-containing protein [Candidatus Kapabacteria bacterium]|nr:OB-fold nucleic acid binding domain-containing protein [Candidatus Kapabacteria bacterium]